MSDRELSLAVVGIDFANADKSTSNRRFEIELCAPGDPVELVPEPRNPHDRNAVAVFSERGVQLGYLSAERAPWIGGKLANGEPYIAVFQELGKRAAAIRVRFGGETPTLPVPQAKATVDEFTAEPDIDQTEWGC